MKKQPLVIDVFPQTGFTPGPVSATEKLKLGADLKFQQGFADASAGANAALTFKYAPTFPSVISGSVQGPPFGNWLRPKKDNRSVACPSS